MVGLHYLKTNTKKNTCVLVVKCLFPTLTSHILYQQICELVVCHRTSYFFRLFRSPSLPLSSALFICLSYLPLSLTPFVTPLPLSLFTSPPVILVFHNLSLILPKSFYTSLPFPLPPSLFLSFFPSSLSVLSLPPPILRPHFCVFISKGCITPSWSLREWGPSEVEHGQQVLVNKATE